MALQTGFRCITHLHKAITGISVRNRKAYLCRKLGTVGDTKHLVTAALPYANGPLHIGHLAGAYIPADIYVRFLRLVGEDVAFICGSDEHGAAITLRAKKEGISPRDIVDKYHTRIKNAFEELGIDFDIYHRTSSPEHHQTASDYFKKLYEKGAFIEKESEQFFDEQEQQFLADRYITGECPKCGHPDAFGDQCEKCGSSLSPQELKNPRSVLSGNTPVLRKTSHWYLPLEKHEHWLRGWIENGTLDGRQHHDPRQWRNHVLGQCKSWIDGGLQPRAMTRDLDWGVPVPLENAEGKVLYVWLDAPIGYITATRVWADRQGRNWQDYWMGDDARITHFIGKDNIVFHCLIFPILLREHGDFNLPVNVPANAFLNLEGSKISTSRNWAVWLHEYLEEYPDRKDELRYVLCAISPESRDSEFTWKDFQARVNNELVAILGNFINRVLVLTHKYYTGEVPEADEPVEGIQALQQAMEQAPQAIEKAIREYRFKEAQAEAMNLARAGNKFLAETEPWKRIKTDPAQVATIMHHCIQLCAKLSVILRPFLPVTAEKLAAALNWQGTWSDLKNPTLMASGSHVQKAGLLFQPFEDKEVEKQVNKLEAAARNNEAASSVEAIKANIPFEQFMNLDLRIAKVVAAEKVKKSNKLLQLTLDTGVDRRTVLSGIAKHYSAEDMVGKQVLLLANLAPKKIMGIESQGMVLMAEDADGKLSLVQPDTTLNPGSEVR